MSTKNHKPATTSDILNNPQTQESGVPSTPDTRPSSTSPSTLDTRHSANPFSAATRARCGKVARLPKEIRDQLNEMLLDGVPHAQIIQKLQHQFGPQSNVVPIEPTDASAENGSNDSNSNLDHASRITHHESASHSDPQNPAQIENQNSKIEILSSLTPQHLTTWKRHGGYRDWLRDQQRIEECKLRHELTLDLARSAQGVASYQAAPKVAVAQICQTIIDLGPEGLKEAMKDSPLNCFRLLNALARLINSGLKCETHIQKTATAIENGQRQPIDRARLGQIERELNLL